MPADTGVANSVNSIARSVGAAVASAAVVNLLASSTAPGTGLPREWAYTAAFGLGTAVSVLAAVLAAFGLTRVRRAAVTDQQAAGVADDRHSERVDAGVGTSWHSAGVVCQRG